MRFTPFASSSEGCCYLLESGNLPPLLLDCGLRIEQIKRLMKFKTSNLGAILISHAHQDHARGAFAFAKRGARLIGSAETAAKIREGDWLIPYPKKVYLVEGWRISAFEVPHDEPGTLAFIVSDQSEKTLLYLTDAAYSPYTFDELKLTHIAIECNHSRAIIQEKRASDAIGSQQFRRTVSTHMSLERLVELLRANRLPNLEEIHLLHLSDANSDEAEFKSEIQRVTGVPVYVAPKRRSA